MLEAIELSRRGGGGESLLEGVTLQLAGGARAALAGASGAGKTVLLRALVLLDPLAGGRVEWRGREPRADAIPAYRRTVHYLAQKPVVDDDRVARQLAIPWTFRVAGETRPELERAVPLLERVGRDRTFLDLDGSHLSGGEAQLLALIRALLLAPTVLLLDEPTAAMDPAMRDGAEQLLEEWQAASPERSWLWVSHDPEQRRRMCDRQWTLAGGRLQGDG